MAKTNRRDVFQKSPRVLTRWQRFDRRALDRLECLAFNMRNWLRADEEIDFPASYVEAEREAARHRLQQECEEMARYLDTLS